MSLRQNWGDKFKIGLRNYFSSDGQIEFDLVGGKNNICYIFEIKWRNKSASYRDLERFLGKVKVSEFSFQPKKLFFIPKSFTEKALGFAQEGSIVLLDERLSVLK
ncbi:MAG: hypothetical protein U9Q22_08315 [Candidatus Altiarchaeota archaeon]|nr:hypothetical protein [Candidatus Altiarchaeota archaeon]